MADKIHIGGDVTGNFVSKSRGVTITTHTGGDPDAQARGELVRQIAAVRALLDRHAEAAPTHRMTNRLLTDMETKLDKPVARSEIGELWDDLLPTLRSLTEAVPNSLGQHLATISASVAKLPEGA